MKGNDEEQIQFWHDLAEELLTGSKQWVWCTAQGCFPCLWAWFWLTELLKHPQFLSPFPSITHLRFHAAVSWNHPCVTSEILDFKPHNYWTMWPKEDYEGYVICAVYISRVMPVFPPPASYRCTKGDSQKGPSWVKRWLQGWMLQFVRREEVCTMALKQCRV